jgi:predicted NUDIX family NTP pyrophosphohydrolase
MNKKVSAGLMMYRFRNGILEILLAHPGGPFFKNKDSGWWSIAKGEPDENEDLLETAKREFKEETGITPEGNYVPLDSIVQKGGKTVYAWAFEGDAELGNVSKSNTFEAEWPPHSGKKMIFQEIDKIEFFPVDTAKKKIKEAQVKLIERLEEYLKNKQS